MYKNISAFSLIEVVIGVALFAMLMVTVNVALIDTFKTSRRVEAGNSVRNEASLIMNRISRDIEFSSSISGCYGSSPLNSDQLTLDRIEGNSVLRITYNLDQANGRITRKVDAGPVTAMSSPGIRLDKHPDCPYVFVCTAEFVTVCMRGNVTNTGIDSSDTANANGGLKFYNQIIRRNSF